MSNKKKDRKTIEKSNHQTHSLMAIQAKLDLFKNIKEYKAKESHDYLKKSPRGFI